MLKFLAGLGAVFMGLAAIRLVEKQGDLTDAEIKKSTAETRNLNAEADRKEWQLAEEKAEAEKNKAFAAAHPQSA